MARLTQRKCKFSQEQWKEIDEARERLAAYKLKVQPYQFDYPLMPEPPKPQEQVIIHRHSNMGKLEYDILQQTSRQVKHLQAKMDELSRSLDKKRKSRYD